MVSCRPWHGMEQQKQVSRLASKTVVLRFFQTQSHAGEFVFRSKMSDFSSSCLLHIGTPPNRDALAQPSNPFARFWAHVLWFSRDSPKRWALLLKGRRGHCLSPGISSRAEQRLDAAPAMAGDRSRKGKCVVPSKSSRCSSHNCCSDFNTACYSI